MIRNFEYLIVFTSAPGVLPEQNDQYQIQPWKVNEIKAYNKCGKVGAKETACTPENCEVTRNITEATFVPVLAI